MAQKEPIKWVTINGNHVPIYEDSGENETWYQHTMKSETSIPKRQKAISRQMRETDMGEFIELNAKYKLKKGRDDIWQLYANEEPSISRFKDEWLKLLTETKTKGRYM